MLANSLRTRGVVFAFLCGPPRFVSREQASTLYNRLCDELKSDDIAFQYTTPTSDERPRSRGFGLRFERKEGRGGFLIELRHAGGQEPFHFVAVNDWPQSLPHVTEQFDLAANAILGGLGDPMQRVLAEARIRAQCDTREQDALRFLREHLLNIGQEQLNRLGQPLVFGSIRLIVGASASFDDTLSGPRREITIEVLQEDPRCLYLESMSQWSQVSPELGAATQVMPFQPRPIDRQPSEYVNSAHHFLTEQVAVMAT